MRLIALFFVAACELQPPPPAPAPVVTPTPVAAVDATGAVAPPVDAAALPDAMTVTAECVVTGAHKASYEQARDRIVRTTAEACTSQLWTADAQHCYGLCKLKADLEACEKKFPRPEPAVPHPIKR